jgi:cytochrome P450
MGILDNTGDGPRVYTAYTFDTVKAVFTDNEAFSTRCYEAIVRPLQGPTILELDEPEHQVYRKLHEHAFARASMRRWEY